jgi:hypothetical protein
MKMEKLLHLIRKVSLRSWFTEATSRHFFGDEFACCVLASVDFSWLELEVDIFGARKLAAE